MSYAFQTLARWRTWLVNLGLALLVILPDALNAPEILMLIPAQYQSWFIAAAFLINIWMRPRPAVLPGDAEVTRQERGNNQ